MRVREGGGRRGVRVWGGRRREKGSESLGRGRGRGREKGVRVRGGERRGVRVWGEEEGEGE